MAIDRPAIKTSSGKVVPAACKGLKHKDIDATGQRGFKTDSGKFVNRSEGAKIAKAAGQVPKSVKSLHSHHLNKGKK